MAGKTFRHDHRVTYADCTLGNHVYYARYLDILEAARGELFRQLGQSFLHWQDRDTIFPVIDCRLRYKRAARYDELLRIELWLTTLGKMRLDFAYQVFAPNRRLLIEAMTQHVCTNVVSKPKRIPEELAASLAPYVAARVP